MLPDVFEKYNSLGAELNVMPFCSQFIPMEVCNASYLVLVMCEKTLVYSEVLCSVVYSVLCSIVYSVVYSVVYIVVCSV